MADTILSAHSTVTGWTLMEIWLIGATLVFAALTFFAMVTNWFKPSIPMDFGFLVNNKIQKTLEISTGDKAKKIPFRCQNTSQLTVSGLTIDVRFMLPLALSGTGSAVPIFGDTESKIHTRHSRILDKDYYWIQHFDLVLPGEDNIDFEVELNTDKQLPGTKYVKVWIYTTKNDYKRKKSNLSIKMK